MGIEITQKRYIYSYTFQTLHDVVRLKATLPALNT